MEEIVVVDNKSSSMLPPRKPRWKKHWGIVLSSAAVLVCVVLYAYKTQSIMKDQRELLEAKDKSLTYYAQEIQKLQKVNQEQSKSLRSQVSEATKKQQDTQNSHAALIQENAKLKDLLNQWKAYYEKIKHKLNPPVKKADPKVEPKKNSTKNPKK